TISAEPEHRGDIERGADAAVDYLRAIGADAQKVETPGNPVVIGKFITDKDRPVVTVYNHLDVQPANEPQWLRAPFMFHKDGNRYIGRGSTDDKGPALTALFGARYAAEQGIPINIQFVWELEEEIGSPNFERFMKDHELRKMRDGDDADVASRIWARPTFEVHGIVGGYTGPGVKTAIPYRAEAKVSTRLVPNQSPGKVYRLVRKFIQTRNPDVEVYPESFLAPYLGPHTGPYADAAREAMRTGFGKDPAFVREGGSIGAVVTMQKYWKAPI